MDSIRDSSNLTVSPTINLLAFKYTNPTSVVEGLVTIWPTALLVWPITLSPIIAFTSKPRPLTNCRVSRVGVLVPSDSYTATISTTSGVFREISLSSTLRP